VTGVARRTRNALDGFVPLVAALPLHADPARVARLVADGAAPWGGERIDDVAAGMRRYAVDLRLQVGGSQSGFTTFRKAARLDLGDPRRTAEGWSVEIGWQAATATPLFPVFSGTLSIRTDELRLSGLYAPPGGVVGRVADRALLHLAANGTARWLLTALDAAGRPPSA
jgi:hypothetical protein